MKVTIETIYENVDQGWLDWYLKRLGNEQVLPGSTNIIKELKENGYASFSSKDPSSNVIATTKYKVVKL